MDLTGRQRSARPAAAGHGPASGGGGGAASAGSGDPGDPRNGA